MFKVFAIRPRKSGGLFWSTLMSPPSAIDRIWGCTQNAIVFHENFVLLGESAGFCSSRRPLRRSTYQLPSSSLGLVHLARIDALQARRPALHHQSKAQNQQTLESPITNTQDKTSERSKTQRIKLVPNA